MTAGEYLLQLPASVSGQTQTETHGHILLNNRDLGDLGGFFTVNIHRVYLNRLRQL